LPLDFSFSVLPNFISSLFCAVALELLRQIVAITHVKFLASWRLRQHIALTVADSRITFRRRAWLEQCVQGFFLLGIKGRFIILSSRSDKQLTAYLYANGLDGHIFTSSSMSYQNAIFAESSIPNRDCIGFGLFAITSFDIRLIFEITRQLGQGCFACQIFACRQICQRLPDVDRISYMNQL